MDEHENTVSRNEPLPQDSQNDLLPLVDDGEPISLRMIRGLRLCWAMRRTIYPIIACGVILSVLYAFSLPASYSSSTTLMPPDSGSSSANLTGLLSTAGPASSVGGAALGLKNPSAIFVAILQSRTAQEGVVKRLDLQRHYKVPNMEAACKILAGNTSVHDDLKTGITTIGVNASSPTMAASIASEYVAQLNAVLINNSTSAARRERVFLGGRLEEIEKDLNESGKALSQFSVKNKMVDLTLQGRATVESSTKLQEQLATARIDLAGLEQVYAADNVKVRAARARVAELQHQIAMMIGSTSLSSSHPDKAYTSVSDLPAIGIAYQDLERRVRVEEILWDTLTRQYEAAKVQEAKELPTVRVLDAALIPTQKSGPNRKNILIFGTFLSVIVAGLIVFFTNVWRTMDDQDVRKVLVFEVVEHLGKTFAPMLRILHTRF